MEISSGCVPWWKMKGVGVFIWFNSVVDVAQQLRAGLYEFFLRWLMQQVLLINAQYALRPDAPDGRCA